MTTPHPRAETIRKLRKVARKMRWVHQHKRAQFNQDIIAHPGGKAACTLAWTTTIPEFKKAGLRLTKRGHVTVNGRSELVARLVFFDIKYAEYMRLFSWTSVNGVRTPLQSARNIGQLIREIEGKITCSH